MKTIIRKIINLFGFDVVRLDSKDNNHRPKKRSSRSASVTYYETATGNYFLPTDATNDIIVKKIISGEIFEQEVVDLALKYIKPGTVVLDIGSNFGQMSVLFARQLGIYGKVLAFEADDFIFSILKRNIAANKLEESVKPFFGAVHNVDNVELVFPEQDFKRFETYGAYGVDYNARAGRKVKSLTIDSLNLQERISFMKIDIQGGDLQAMQGAINTIARNRMPILFEYEYQFEDEFGYCFQDYVNFVSSIGYRFAKVINGHNFLILPK